MSLSLFWRSASGVERPLSITDRCSQGQSTDPVQNPERLAPVGSAWFRQQVLALNLWTSYTPSWEVDEESGRVMHRPPPGFGSALGGFDRLRAFPESRFHDKSAVYYAAELRLIPRVNGLNGLPLLRHLEIDWWQVAGFLEAGRVAPAYNSDLFTQDLKWDVGLSFRVMYSQPFAR